LYIDYFWRSPELYKNIKNLRKKTLACWCKPKPCHCDFLCTLANEGESTDEEDNGDVSDSERPTVPLPEKKLKRKMVTKNKRSADQ
jgi:hypothetical protein